MTQRARRGTVLIVDDEASARQVTQDLLSSEDHDVFVAASGAEALNMLTSIRPDVIVSDLMMPGMDGVAFCAALRQRADTRATPVIIVTALDSRKEMVRALNAGATDFLTKPVHGVELRARIRSMMRVANEHRLLEQILRLRSDLTNMALHDMRNPLQGVSLGLDVLARRVQGERVTPVVERMRSGVSRLQRLIDDILLAAKSESGEVTVDRAPVRAADLLTGAVDDVRPIAELARIHLTVTASADLWIHVDSSLFRRCLENLLGNAVKFSPPGSTVTISTVATGNLVTTDVADEGPGVPADDREAIFGRFHTAHAPPGLAQFGLGLAFCRMVVEAHGGDIAALPREPHGTIFRITLPQPGPEVHK